MKLETAPLVGREEMFIFQILNGCMVVPKDARRLLPIILAGHWMRRYDVEGVEVRPSGL